MLNTVQTVDVRQRPPPKTLRDKLLVSSRMEKIEILYVTEINEIIDE